MIEHIANNIRSIRLQKGYSQKQLAERCEMEEKFISSLETKPRHISTRTLERIALGLDVSPETLLSSCATRRSENTCFDEVAIRSLEEAIRLLRILRAQIGE